MKLVLSGLDQASGLVVRVGDGQLQVELDFSQAYVAAYPPITNRFGAVHRLRVAWMRVKYDVRALIFGPTDRPRP